ncbi:MAG: sensor histidine kinase, partial [Devosia nanyangense]|nr:sensor histidine kinase [Devosia nanyangense]
AVFEARQRLTSSSGTLASYDYKLLADYAASRVSGALTMPVLLVILALFSSLWVPPLAAAAWAGAVIAAHFAVVFVCRRFIAADKEKFDAQRTTASFVAAETGYGIAWALVALFTLTGGGQNLAVALFAMVLVGAATNAVATRTLPAATLVSTLPAVLTVSINLVVLGGTLNYALAAVAVGGEFFFVYLARQLHGSELETVAH